MTDFELSRPTAVAAECPICGMPSTRTIPAQIALFLRIKCDIAPDVEGLSHFCRYCEHVFFTPMLSPPQLEKLYTGYRGPLYNQLRLAVEPGYAYHAAQFADPNSDHDNARRDFYDRAFPRRGSAKVVIDFGGGDGQFSRYVFPDAAITIVEEDFERSGGNLRETLGGADFFFCAQVVEHLPRPLDVLTPLVAHLPGGSSVWIEVPQEYPDTVAATFGRLAAGSGEVSALRTMHEHVAHYSLTSLSRLAERLGLEPQVTASLHGINGILSLKPASAAAIEHNRKRFLPKWLGRRQNR